MGWAVNGNVRSGRGEVPKSLWFFSHSCCSLDSDCSHGVQNPPRAISSLNFGTLGGSEDAPWTNQIRSHRHKARSSAWTLRGNAKRNNGKRSNMQREYKPVRDK